MKTLICKFRIYISTLVLTVIKKSTRFLNCNSHVRNGINEPPSIFDITWADALQYY